MNERYKFRGKRIDNGEWVVGDLLKPNDSCRIVNYDESDNEDGNLTDFHYFDVEPESVGQYTGLKDKNWKELFEGDIIVINRYKEEAIIEWNDELGFFALRCYGCEIGKKPLGEWLQEFDLFLIGNIHNNKYLLNEK